MSFFSLNWKIISIIVLMIISFLSGYYIRTLQYEANKNKELNSKIDTLKDDLLYNKSVDIEYNNKIDSINIENETHKIGVSYEKDAHCLIPTEWVHTLNSITR